MRTASVKRKERDWFKDENNRNSVAAQRNTSNMMMSPASASYFGPLSNLFSDIERMFENTFRSFGLPALSSVWDLPAMFRPNVDITSSEDSYTITVEVPSMEEKDIRLDISTDGLLTISGEKRQEETEARKDTVCTECSYGSFQRSISLPEDADQENIEASFRNGLLTITCLRRESLRQQKRQIPISGVRRGPEEARSNDRTGQAPKKAA